MSKGMEDFASKKSQKIVPPYYARINTSNSVRSLSAAVYSSNLTSFVSISLALRELQNWSYFSRKKIPKPIAFFDIWLHFLIENLCLEKRRISRVA